MLYTIDSSSADGLLSDAEGRKTHETRKEDKQSKEEKKEAAEKAEGAAGPAGTGDCRGGNQYIQGLSGKAGIPGEDMDRGQGR